MIDMILAILLTFVLTLLVCVFLGRLYFFKKKNEEEVKLRKMLERVVNKQSESQLILASLNMGVIAYGNDNILLLSNDAASQMLHEIPHNFEAFLDLYDDDQKIRANLLLGKKHAERTFVDQHIHYRLSIEERNLEKNKKAAHIIVIQDITRQVYEEQQRKEFVANVSHELKTPLTTIKTYSESLLDWGIDEKSKDSIKKDIERLYNGSIRMESLINDLLLLSRIDGKAIYTRFEKKELLPFVRSCIFRTHTQADQKNIDISSFAVVDKTMAYIDTSSFERILMNLISNAIKYTPNGGEIKVYIGSLIDDVYIKVVDNGIGIPQEAQQNIFKRFYRVDTTGSREHGGTGLGLSIVKELVDLHLGQIDLKSEVGVGSEFTILLPSVKKVLRSALFQLVENGTCSNMVTKAAEEEVTKLAKSLNIMAQWKSLQSTEVDKILKIIENEY